MAQTDELIDEPCLNCGDATPGQYCRVCGQRKGEVRVSMRRLIADVLEDQLSINSALPRTITSLFLRPGRLTAEYSRGRIASYIAPFRLYLVASLAFFLVASLSSRMGLANDIEVNSNASQLATGETGTPDGSADDAAATEPQDPSADSTTAGDDAGPAPESSRSQIGIFFSDEDLESDSVDWGKAINTGVPVLDEMIEARARSMGRMEPREAIGQLAAGFFEYAPAAMFILLPIFALLLKLLYIRSNRYYVEHFVFALHYHAFAFLIFTVIILLPDAVMPGLLVIWLFVYLPIALRRVYGQGLFKTTVKWFVLSGTYSVLVVLGMFATAVTAFLLG